MPVKRATVDLQQGANIIDAQQFRRNSRLRTRPDGHPVGCV